MNRLFVLSICLFGFIACSNNSGDLVDKSPGTTTPSGEASAKSELPDSHPPIGSNASSGGFTMPMAGAGSQAVIDGTVVKAGVLSFTVDPDWVSEPPKNAMRSAQFLLPSPDALKEGAGELVLFHGITGSAEANIQRWIGQFSERKSEPLVEKKKVGDLSVHVLDVGGLYSGAMGMPVPNAEKTETRMLAAVVEGHPKGPWFFKLTGPIKTLEHWKPAFNAMIETIEILP